jgi:hypothetical protein
VKTWDESHQAYRVLVFLKQTSALWCAVSLAMLAELSGPDELSDVACQVWWQNSHRSYLARKKIALSADSEAKLKSQETLAVFTKRFLETNFWRSSFLSSFRRASTGNYNFRAALASSGRALISRIPRHWPSVVPNKSSTPE